jgi:hypothetical protein
MAGKTIDKIPMNIEQLRAKLAEKLTGTPLEIEGWGTVEVTMLKAVEVQEINRATRDENGNVPIQNAWQWNCTTAAKGLVTPSMTPEEAAQYPPEFIMPIANKVWELTNAYQAREAKAADEPVNPFPRRSSSSSGSPTDTTASPAT